MAMKRPRRSLPSKGDTTLTQIGFVSTPFRSAPSESEGSDIESNHTREYKDSSRPHKRRKVSKTESSTRTTDHVENAIGVVIDVGDLENRDNDDIETQATALFKGNEAIEASSPRGDFGPPTVSRRRRSRSEVHTVDEHSDEERIKDETANAARKRQSNGIRRVPPPATPDVDIGHLVTDDEEEEEEEEEDYKPIQTKRSDSSRLLTPAASGGSSSRKMQCVARKQSNTLTQMIRGPLKKRKMLLHSQWQPDWESQGIPAYRSPRRTTRTRQDLEMDGASSTQLKSPPASSPVNSNRKRVGGFQTPRKPFKHLEEVPSSQTPPSIKFSSQRPTWKDTSDRSPLKERSANVRSNISQLRNSTDKDPTGRSACWTKPTDSMRLTRHKYAKRSPYRKLEHLHTIPDSEGYEEINSLEGDVFKDLTDEPSSWHAGSSKKILRRTETVQDSQPEATCDLLLSDSGINQDVNSDYETDYNTHDVGQRSTHDDVYDTVEQAAYDPACSALDRDAARAWQYTQCQRRAGSEIAPNDGEEAGRYDGETTADEATDDETYFLPVLESQETLENRLESRRPSNIRFSSDKPAKTMKSSSGSSNEVFCNTWECSVPRSSSRAPSPPQQSDNSKQQDIIPCSQRENLEQASDEYNTPTQSSPTTVPTQPLSPVGKLQNLMDSQAREPQSNILPEWSEMLGSSSPFTRPPWSSPQLPSSTQMHEDRHANDLQLDSLVDFSLPPPPPISSIRETPLHSSES
ncbi:hypothetical protein K431DRAFT_280216 [Polychaeton citri CBS 116435]|uniref:Uncharacterized protein n=1 Tax=Polychaeton citri CBS 116435 TaxID=1314669 RepID=A0A9P4QGT2_9PEZI|nr:hypothetical protein K431DRAFT_280216 [Polychaeton citri CBS 116435]